MRDDGELYQRPEPNPFTNEWRRGYDDGITGRPESFGPPSSTEKPSNYRDGWECGDIDRQEIDRMGSSNT